MAKKKTTTRGVRKAPGRRPGLPASSYPGLTRAGKGRPPGSQNKVTKSMKEAVRAVFDNLGGVAAFTVWAGKHPEVFYSRIAARLIPHEIVGPGEDGEHRVTLVQHVHES